MKNKIVKVIFLIVLYSQFTYGQDNKNNSSEYDINQLAQSVPTEKGSVKVVNRKSISFDFNSWFESLKVQSGGSTYETRGLLYGTGVSYEYSRYFPDWGWGGGGGILHGYGVAGNSTDISSYYVRRVPQTMLRANARIFKRIGVRMDLGLALNFNYRSTVWPSANGWEVKSGVNPLIGLFLDTRWRVNLRWDLVQALGSFSRDSSLAWKIGGVYNF